MGGLGDGETRRLGEREKRRLGERVMGRKGDGENWRLRDEVKE